MDEQMFKLIGQAVKEGFALPIVLWFLWDKKRDMDARRNMEAKKAVGEYVSYEDVKALKENVNAVNANLNGHLLKASEDGIKLAKMEVKMESIDEKIETENAHIFGQLKSIHQAISELMKHYGDSH